MASACARRGTCRGGWDRRFPNGEQLVPTGELRPDSLDFQRIDRAATAVLARVGGGHRHCGFLGQQNRHPLVFQMSRFEPVQEIAERGAHFALGTLHGTLQMALALLQLDTDRHASGVFLRQFVAVRFENVPPGFDHEFMTGDLGRREVALPAVIDQRLEPRTPPAALALDAPAHRRRELVVTVGKDLARHTDRLANDAFCREATAVDDRLARLDGDTWHSHGLGESWVEEAECLASVIERLLKRWA